MDEQSIGDLVRAPAPTFSFEFFPPRYAEQETQLWTAIRELESLQPSFVSITYGAGGSTRDNTVAATEQIATETTLLPMAHLTAVNHSVAELRHMVGRLADAGVRNVLAVRGDPPGDPTAEWIAHPAGPALRRRPGRARARRRATSASVWPRSRASIRGRPTIEDDTRHFVAKCRSGADFAITQMFFDADDYLRLRDRVAAAGLRHADRRRRHAGDEHRHDRHARRSCPARRSRRRSPLSSSGSPTIRRRCGKLGIEQMTEMCARLLDEGVPGIHFITLNRSTATRELWRDLAAVRV